MKRMGGMDAELLRLLEAVRGGRIKDDDRCRQILRDGRTANLADGEVLQADNQKLRDAEKAFLQGWSKSDISHP